jgi:hypothetical protein
VGSIASEMDSPNSLEITRITQNEREWERETRFVESMSALWDDMGSLTGKSEAEAEKLEANGAHLLVLGSGIAAENDGERAETMAAKGWGLWQLGWGLMIDWEERAKAEDAEGALWERR